MSELRTIPNIGACTEQDLILMGYTTIASLRGKSAEELYAEECRLRGCTLDRCQLYLYRAVEYFVNTGNPDPMKCKWWFWKDDFVEPSPCGAVCVECASFPLECGGCRKIKEKYSGCGIRVMMSAAFMTVAAPRGKRIAVIVRTCLAGIL